MIDWCGAFTFPKGIMSDGPTFFTNGFVDTVTKGLKLLDHFTLPYCSWSNGGIERLLEDIIRIFHVTVSEPELSQEHWPDLLALV